MNGSSNQNMSHVRSGICRKLHFCMVCGKAYCRKIELDMHLFCHSVPLLSPENLWRRHVTDLMTQCPCCSRGFCRRQDLIHHMDGEGNCTGNCTREKSTFTPKTEKAENSYCTDLLNLENCMQKPMPCQMTDRHVNELGKSSRKLDRQCAIVQRFLDAEKRTPFAEIESDENNNTASFRKRGRPKNNVRSKDMESISRESSISPGRHLEKRGKKYFQCQQCYRVFNNKTNLIIHARIHTDTRPYNCKFCHKSFRQLSHVRCHERRHTMDEPYSCEVCSKRFKQPSGLFIHCKKNHV
ncbi:zinc finger protein 761-like [Saccostrea echinata]|uniref:zinc finger protein 761-like n=1 Tax=Saccostrea echinata TaxID=191078 RepID=UPI002A7F5E25|nr:zinc finger protein 761-like [Saccostrea echinata]